MAQFKNRGIMLDSARMLEKRDYYMDLLPWFKEWGYNILHWHFTDDQGCTLKFPSHPELASDKAFSAEEMKAFVKTAKKNKIEIIPELESFGHTNFITSHRKYAHLGGKHGKNSGFNALHPKNKEVRTLLRDLFRDIAEIFPSGIIHAGLDEVDLSGIPEFSHFTRETQWKAFAPHALWVHQEIRKLGRRPAMWGDHLLHSPELAKKIKKDVLIFDWHYDAPFNPTSLQFLTDAGFEVWGCPASMQWNQKVLPTVRCQFQNIREFTACAIHYQNKGCTGMVNTVWTPWRYLSGVMDLPMAFGGHIFSEKQESADFCVDFASSFYGLNKSDAASCAEAIWGLHSIAPMRDEYVRLIQGQCYGVEFNRENARRFDRMAKDAVKYAKQIKPFVRKATRHAERLNDYIITARILEAFGTFGGANRKKGSAGDVKPLLRLCDASWRRTKEWPWTQVKLPYTGTEWLLPTLKTLPMLPVKEK